MATRLDFDAHQRKQLNDLKLCDEQVVELRNLLPHIRGHLSKPPAKNDVADMLDRVATQCDQLADTLRSLVILDDASHAAAAALIEVGYWAAHPDDCGPTAAHHMVRRLDTLVRVALEAKAALPKAPTRHRTGNPQPIQWIDEALLHGWVKRHGKPHSWTRKHVQAHQLLLPSVSEASQFHEIVEVCYAAGYRRFPKRALEAYVKAQNETRNELLRNWPN